jgi:signal transduction histidine kinase
MLGVTLFLTTLNGSFQRDPFFIPVAIAMMLGYDTVGAIVASRNPRNPIGWLMMVIGLGFVLTALADEYATYAYLTNPGALPFRLAAGWLTNWVAIIPVAPIPILLTLFPDGRIPSRRWRLLPAATVAATATLAIGVILNPGILDITEGVVVSNPTGVPALDAFAHALIWIGGLGLLGVAVASIVALVLRFRRSRGEERQQVRWLAYVAALGGVTLGMAILTGIGMKVNESRPLNDIAFFVFFVCIGIGVPLAVGVAVLRYRLWDLDVVIKKTVVAAIVVAFVTAVLLFVVLLVGGLFVGGISERPGLTLLTGVALGLLFAPLRRLSRRVADRIVYGGRATPYEVLADFSERMAETYSTDDILPRMASILASGTGAETTTIWLLVGRELRPAASWPADARPEEARPMTALVDVDPNAFEVRHQGDLLGAITVTMPANDPMNPSKEKLVRDLASQAGLVLRNVRLIEELRASRRRLVAAQDAERRRLERNIHDGAQQQLVALAVKLRLTEQLAERDPTKAREMLGQLQEETHDALEDLRDLARGIYPPLLADKGLTAALEAQARKVPVPVEVEPDGIGRYGEEIEAAVYFCCLEALQNVSKYASASSVRIGLSEDGHALAFEVRDDGVGFDPSAAQNGTGLQGMADRLEAIGGALSISSAPGTGTTVAGRLPIGASGR